jgi:hypothetical protein
MATQEERLSALKSLIKLQPSLSRKTKKVFYGPRVSKLNYIDMGDRIKIRCYHTDAGIIRLDGEVVLFDIGYISKTTKVVMTKLSDLFGVTPK